MRKSIAELVCCLSVAVSVVFAASSSSSAAGSKKAVITGKVMECGPGPIVVSPPATQPLPKPASVILMHDNHTYVREAIKFPKSLPWSGSFLFNVPAGRYEVLSTYFARARWVNVKPGSRMVVTFAPIACPL